MPFVYILHIIFIVAEYKYKASASTAFSTESEGIVARLVHISALGSISCNAVKGKARTCLLQASNTHTHGHIVVSSVVMSYTNE